MARVAATKFYLGSRNDGGACPKAWRGLGGHEVKGFGVDEKGLWGWGTEGRWGWRG